MTKVMTAENVGLFTICIGLVILFINIYEIGRLAEFGPHILYVVWILFPLAIILLGLAVIILDRKIEKRRKG